MTLSLTTDAAHVISEIVAEHPGAGLRISPRSANGSEMQLGLALTEEPAPTDQVIVKDGSRVFLDKNVAPLLEDKTLDVDGTNGDAVAFKLVRQD
jgi:Fe-S cluster assembly iron-binding protein IscA